MLPLPSLKTERRAYNFVVTAATIPSGFWKGFIEISILMIHLTGLVRMPPVEVRCLGSGTQRSAPSIRKYRLHPLFTNVLMFPKPPIYGLGNGCWVMSELVLRKRGPQLVSTSFRSFFSNISARNYRFDMGSKRLWVPEGLENSLHPDLRNSAVSAGVWRHALT